MRIPYQDPSDREDYTFVRRLVIDGVDVGPAYVSSMIETQHEAFEQDSLPEHATRATRAHPALYGVKVMLWSPTMEWHEGGCRELLRLKLNPGMLPGTPETEEEV